MKFLKLGNLFLVFTLISHVKGQTEQLQLFAEEKLLNAEIKFDLSAYLRKNLKGQALEGTIIFNPGTSDSLSRGISIKTRGKFRLEKCAFPPMEITFKKPVYSYPDSGKFRKVKLVTHCKSGTLYDEYVLKEYLIYRLFNVMTDSSYRVRLLKITYSDKEESRKPITQYGFFIEPKAVLASRINTTVVPAMNIYQNGISYGVMDRVSIFNYMVGSWDWAVQSQHNIAIFKSLSYDPLGLGIAVPYDFDLTGIVDPEYNLPPPESELTSNRDRLFMGICRDKAIYRERLKEFIAKKDQLYAVINNFEYLNDRSKKNIIYYLDGFFDQLDKEKNIDNLIEIFISQCKKL
jgi:hypothetical protein